MLDKNWDKKQDKVLDKKWTNILETFGGGGGSGGTPLAVTQEDSLVEWYSSHDQEKLKQQEGQTSSRPLDTLNISTMIYTKKTLKW